LIILLTFVCNWLIFKNFQLYCEPALRPMFHDAKIQQNNTRESITEKERKERFDKRFFCFIAVISLCIPFLCGFPRHKTLV